MHNAQEGGPGNTAGKATDLARLEVNNEGVAEASGHESDLGVIRGKVCALAEVGEEFLIRGKMIERATRVALRI
jgi:hypothetical protein